MHTRRRLRSLFDASGFDEALFLLLDDLSVGGLNWRELNARRALRSAGMAYPEHCLLGVYRKR